MLCVCRVWVRGVRVCVRIDVWAICVCDRVRAYVGALRAHLHINSDPRQHRHDRAHYRVVLVRRELCGWSEATS